MKKSSGRGLIYLLYAGVAGAAVFVLAFIELPPNLTIWTGAIAMFLGAMILYAKDKRKKE